MTGNRGSEEFAHPAAGPPSRPDGQERLGLDSSAAAWEAAMSAQGGVRQDYDMWAATVAPPRWMLIAAVVTAAAAAALLPAASFARHVAGYALGSFATIGLVASFAQIDVRRRQHPRYAPLPGLRALSALALVIGISAAAVHVVFIALELASR